MLIETIAKQRYLEDHPNKQRAPKGFRDGAFLRLTGVESGSAIAVINLIADDSQYGLPKFSEDTSSYFKVARDEIVDAIASAAVGKNINLAPEFLWHFDRIGKNLREEEFIDFGKSNEEDQAILNKETRKKLVIASRSNEITEPVWIRAYVPAMDQKGMTIRLKLISGKMISANLREQHYSSILESFNAYRSSGKVLIGGSGKYDYRGNLKKIDSIDEVIALDDLDVPSQIEELKSLKAGWMNGEGEAYGSGELDWLADCFDRLYPDGFPLPYVFPNVDGEVIAEWSFPPTEISLSVDLGNQKGEFHALNVRNDAEEREIYDLYDARTWIEISQKIAYYANE